MRVLVVLPTYNERENIVAILEAVRAALPASDVLVVDDSSPDGTAELAAKAGAELGAIEVLVRAQKEGLGPAYRAGFAWGLARGYDAFVEMDSDFSHDPGALASLVAPLEGGVDVVVGSRYVPGGEIPAWSLSRRLLSRAGNLYAKTMLSLGVEDATSGFRVYSRRCLETIDLAAVRADGYGFQVEMTYRARRAGMAIREVPIRFVDRVEGSSKMSLHTVVEALTLVSAFGLRRLLEPASRRALRGPA